MVTNLDFQFTVWEESFQKWNYTHSVVVYLPVQPEGKGEERGRKGRGERRRWERERKEEMEERERRKGWERKGKERERKRKKEKKGEREKGKGEKFNSSTFGEKLTDGSSGPLVSPLSVIRSGVLAKGARRTRGSRE